MRDALMRLMELRAWKPSELSALVGIAEPRKLVERHLKPMLEQGLIVRTHPETPAHPEQAYRARSLQLEEPKESDT
jgi:ATP-dependent DNA helicase RecG